MYTITRDIQTLGDFAVHAPTDEEARALSDYFRPDIDISPAYETMVKERRQGVVKISAGDGVREIYRVGVEGMGKTVRFHFVPMRDEGIELHRKLEARLGDLPIVQAGPTQ